MELSENIRIMYVPSTFLPIQESRITLSFPFLWTKELLKVVKASKCDVIHSCNYDYITALSPIMAKKHFSIPAVITNDALLTGGSYSFGSTTKDFFLRIYTNSIGLKVLKSYDRIVFLYSKLSMEALRLGLSADRIVTIPNGVDVDKINVYVRNTNSAKFRRKYGIREDERVVLFVGRLVKLKRVEIILNMVEELHKKGVRIKALIVGDGPDRARLEKLSQKISSQIVFTGFLSSARFECYRLADLFVLPSISEGLPSVLLEACAFGLPIIATNTNGIPSIVDHGKTGFLVNNWNSKEHIDFAQSVLTDEALARRIRIDAKNRAKFFFSWDRIAERYVRLYEHLVCENKS